MLTRTDGEQERSRGCIRWSVRGIKLQASWSVHGEGPRERESVVQADGEEGCMVVHALAIKA